MRVAVIEDDAISGLFLAETIEREGHEVLGPFASLGEVEALAESDAPEAALVDYRLGGESGDALARHLTERFGTTCVFVTGNPDEARPHTDAAIGIVPKPVSDREVRDLLAYLQALREGRASRPPRRLRPFAESNGHTV